MDPQEKLPRDSWRASFVVEGVRCAVIVEGPYRKIDRPNIYSIDIYGKVQHGQTPLENLEDVRTLDPVLSAPEFLYIVHAKHGAMIPNETWQHIDWSTNGLSYLIRLREAHLDVRRQAIEAYLELEPDAFHLLNDIPPEDDMLRSYLLLRLQKKIAAGGCPFEVLDTLRKRMREDPRTGWWHMTAVIFDWISRNAASDSPLREFVASLPQALMHPPSVHE